MEKDRIHIRMFGEFSFSCGSASVSDRDNRSGKIWLLLAYMVCFKNRTVTGEELADVLWFGDDGASNPVNAMKTMFHRARALLDRVYDGCGRELIVRRNGSYAFNTAADYTLDIDEFERLCSAGKAAASDEEQLACYMDALELYAGDFIPKLSSELWAVPIKTYYHNLYLQTVRETVGILKAQNRSADIERVCRRATEIELFDEDIYFWLIRSLIDTGRTKDAAAVYTNMSEMLVSHFGVMPSEELRELYREAMRTTNSQETDLFVIKGKLREADEKAGAYICDYDFFKALYQVEARAIARSGDAVHICLLTAADASGEQLARRSLAYCMDNLGQVICSCLRKNDVVAKFSASQYIIMLPHANYENSCAIMDRIVKSFRRQYPHSPAELGFTVQALEPIV